VTRGGYRSRHDAADDGMRRRIFPLSLSPEERDALEAAADEAGESMAEYARTAITERIARSKRR